MQFCCVPAKKMKNEMKTKKSDTYLLSILISRSGISSLMISRRLERALQISDLGCLSIAHLFLHHGHDGVLSFRDWLQEWVFFWSEVSEGLGAAVEFIEVIVG
jgi:hypothetical protein